LEKTRRNSSGKNSNYSGGDDDAGYSSKVGNYDMPEWQKRPSARINIRRTSIVGTRAYLAPECVGERSE